MGRKPKEGESTNSMVRAKLLSVAAELFYRKGYAATTIRDIIQKAGVTAPVLYYYFGSKEGIFRELMESVLRQSDPIYENIQQKGGSAKDRILDFATRWYPLFIENKDAVRLLLSMHYGPPEQGIPIFDLEGNHKRFHQTIRNLVKEGIQKGEFHADCPEDLAWVIFSVVNAGMEVEITRPGKGLGQEGIARVLKLILH